MTTPPTTLHDRLRAELDRRLAVARAATPAWANVGTVVEAGPDGVPFVGNDYVVEHIALHDPADAIRRYLGELEVLQRHAPMSGGSCEQCWHGTPDDSTWPCPEIRSLASRLGVNVDNTETGETINVASG